MKFSFKIRLWTLEVSPKDVETMALIIPRILIHKATGSDRNL